MITFTITGLIPSKKNSKRILKRGNKRFIGSQEGYAEWELRAASDAYLLAFRNGWNGVAIGICSIVLDFTFGDKRRRDLTNSAEGIMDAIVKANIIKDDQWQVVPILLLNGKYEKNKWECVVKIEPIGN